jgi:hypothetical protein
MASLHEFRFGKVAFRDLPLSDLDTIIFRAIINHYKSDLDTIYITTKILEGYWEDTFIIVVREKNSRSAQGQSR